MASPGRLMGTTLVGPSPHCASHAPVPRSHCCRAVLRSHHGGGWLPPAASGAGPVRRAAAGPARAGASPGDSSDAPGTTAPSSVPDAPGAPGVNPGGEPLLGSGQAAMDRWGSKLVALGQEPAMRVT